MNKIYAHPGQIYFIKHPAKTKVGVCGRGWGKTTVDGEISSSCVRELPRSRGFFLGLTYTQILTKFLPPILDFWERKGIKEHISKKEPGHYVVGTKPPDFWQKPFAKVKKFQNIISFMNGSYIELLSMDRKDLNLGGSYDWGLADEIQGINKERFYKEYHIGIRGNIYRYKSPLHHSLILTGTMPWLNSGQWILDYEEKAKNSPNDILYIERPSFDNYHALGANYFKKQKAELDGIMYDIEIKNKRVKILGDGFYPDFSEEKHTYYAAYIYDDSPISLNDLSSYTPKSSDYNPQLPLDIAFDFGAKVTCMIISQESNGELRIFDLFYAKSSDMVISFEDDSNRPLQRVVAEFVRNYSTHKNIINIWGDHTGHNKSDKSLSSYEVVERLFRQNKLLYVNKVEKTNNPAHAKKYHAINDILGGRVAKCPKVLINMNKCKPLIVSIQLSPVDNNYSKDKSSERDDKLIIDKQTHLSDAFDYLVYNKYKNILGISSYGSENTSISVGSLS